MWGGPQPELDECSIERFTHKRRRSYLLQCAINCTQSMQLIAMAELISVSFDTQVWESYQGRKFVRAIRPSTLGANRGRVAL